MSLSTCCRNCEAVILTNVYDTKFVGKKKKIKLCQSSYVGKRLCNGIPSFHCMGHRDSAWKAVTAGFNAIVVHSVGGCSQFLSIRMKPYSKRLFVIPGGVFPCSSGWTAQSP